MNEKALTVLEQYDLEMNGTYRTKGNYGCDTTTGRYILQEYNNSNEKMATMKILYNHLEDSGFQTDYVIENKEGSYVSISEDGYSYILKRWFDAEECNAYNQEHILSATKRLAEFHHICENTCDWWGEDKGLHTGKNILKKFSRYTNEIVQIKNYIKKRKNKNYFEIELQKISNDYYNQCVSALDVIRQSEYENVFDISVNHKSINHGSYNYHNIMFDGDMVIFVNLTKVTYAPQIQDLYDFLRKIMEKNNWDAELGRKILDTYDQSRTISTAEYKILKAMMCYPEKFWKIVNYYYNSNKAWYSEKNEEKLKQFQKQEKYRRKFIETM